MQIASQIASNPTSYQPDENCYGTASFDYKVCDNGTRNGAADPKCAVGTMKKGFLYELFIDKSSIDGVF